MRKIDMIVVHVTDTPDHMNFTASDIRRWHTLPAPRGNGWSDIGYHYIVCRSGIAEKGRPVEKPGAHAIGYNARSIGIVWVGRQILNVHARLTLLHLLKGLAHKYGVPLSRIVGHKELDPKKTCPNLDMDWLRDELSKMGVK